MNGLVYELYFPEEVHGAGLRFFDLVEQANLPDLADIPESAHLDRLPPLRIAHDLTERQRAILAAWLLLARRPCASFAPVWPAPPADRTLQLDLAQLRRFGMVGSSGRGRGATYWLERENE